MLKDPNIFLQFMKTQSKGAIAFFVLSALVMGIGAFLDSSRALNPSGFYLFSVGLFVLATYLAVNRKIGSNILNIKF